MINEAQLQSFWRIKSINLKNIKTTCGQTLVIIEPGQYNAHQGPDFKNARINVDNIEWVGNIELHVRSSDWKKHAHQKDINYKNIILHVVWVNDTADYTLSLLLELSKFIEKEQLLQEVDILSTYHLHCSLRETTPIKVAEHKDLYQLGLERMIQRKEHVEQLFHLHKLDYSSVLWRLIFRSFGRSTNADAFESIFLSIPMHVLRLYAFDLNMIEALIMGQSNLLQHQFMDEYPQKLYKQYVLLKHRHGLDPIDEKLKFLRMRPRNFPTIRLAQLAAFFHRNMSLAHILLSIENLKEINYLFDVTPHLYWHTHFLFDRKSIHQNKEIGNAVRQQILLNAFIPFLLAYAEIHNASNYEEKAMRWLKELRPENDALIRMYSTLGFGVHSILDTQSLHELYLRYCLSKKCSSCLRGNIIGQNMITN
jgi:hypothetical protein